jgi:hypothetical protein
VHLIETPTDFETTIGGDASRIVYLVRLAPSVEPNVREALSAIFDDLQYISPDERDVVSTYLDSIEEPLRTLRALGIQLAAAQTSGKLVVSGMIGRDEPAEMPATITVYLVAPRPCFYRPANDPHVHLLGIDCDGERTLLAEGATGRSWPSREAVNQAFEGTVPWCDKCFLHLH